MKAFSILLFFLLFSTGCATTYTSGWQQSLWRVGNTADGNPEIGALETEKLTFNVIVTEFRQVVYDLNTRRIAKENPTFIAVIVTCRNQSSETIGLQANPIQVIGPAQMLAKELPLEHVMYKLYGGRMQEAAQLGRLSELSEPVPVGSTVSSAILASIVEEIRASERASIVSQMYQKEAAQYQLYYHSFDPASLPSGVATSWTQYYPYTVGPIQVMLQGQNVEEGVAFSLPLPDPTLEPKSPFPLKRVIVSCLAFAVFGFVYWTVLKNEVL